MLILALDTATERGSLALVEDGRSLKESPLDSPGAYLTRLMPGVAGLLAAAGRRLEDLGAVAVSQGPGHFTGLRLGVATAKTLAWALKVPLVAVPTLEAVAAQWPQPGPVGVLIDAKRREVYFGLFVSREGTAPAALAEPVRLPVAGLAARLMPPLSLTGPGLDVYGLFLKEQLSPEISWAPPEVRYPRAATVARLGARRLEQGLITPPAQLTPLYLRPAL